MQTECVSVITSSVEDRATVGTDLSATEGPYGQNEGESNGDRSLTRADHWDASNASLSLPPPSPPGEGPPSLDEIETSLQANSTWRLAQASTARKAVVAALAASPSIDAQLLSLTIDDCCSEWSVYQTPNGHRLFPNYCRQRLCPVCQTVRSLKLRPRFRKVFSSMRNPKFLTLTLAARDEPLAASLNRLRRAFAKFRRYKQISGSIRRGLWVLEWKPRPDRAGWHVHLHCLIDAPFIPQRTISALWLRATGDSSIVHICKADKRHLGYLTSYLLKSVADIPAGKLASDYASSIRGIRLHGSWGAKLPMPDPALPSDRPQYLSPLPQVLRLASEGVPHMVAAANDLLSQLPRCSYRFPTYDGSSDLSPPGDGWD